MYGDSRFGSIRQRHQRDMTSKPRSHGEGPPHSWKAAGLWHAETTSPKAYAETDTEYSALSLEQVDILKKHSRMLSRLTLQKPVKQSHRIIDDASLAWPDEVEQYLTNVMGSVFQEISHKKLRESQSKFCFLGLWVCWVKSRYIRTKRTENRTGHFESENGYRETISGRTKDLWVSL